MRAARPSTRRALAAGVAVLLLGGCTATTSGHGTALGGGASHGASGPASGSSSPAPSNRFPRPRSQTSIGDPGTADLCRATPLRALRVPGLTPSYVDGQQVPGCIVRMSRGDRLIYSISTEADSLLPSDDHPTGHRRMSGFRVRVFAFDTATDDCEREVVAQGVYLTVQAYSNTGQPHVSAKIACAGADRATRVIAAAARRGHVPRLTLAHPSLTAVDFCDAAKSLDYSTAPLYAGAQVFDIEFGLACAVNADTQHSFIRVVRIAGGVSKDETPMTVQGHRIYAASAKGSSCEFDSPQGRTGDGFTEELAFFARPTGTSSDQLCTQAATVLVELIEATGLR